MNIEIDAAPRAAFRQSQPPTRSDRERISEGVSPRRYLERDDRASSPASRVGVHESMHRSLLVAEPGAEARTRAADYLRARLAAVAQEACHLPERPEDLHDWMHAQASQVTDDYAVYLAARKSGAPRRYFSNRAHALNFLRAVGPTKQVDGAWLHGLARHWQNPRFDHLIATYVEELGEGMADKNHVALYRRLLAQHGLDGADTLADALYEQGAVQLALGCNAEAFLPEIVGFNLGYEQLPLHLLITAYELNELGIDPYYFTLHVTVDNHDSGHAHRACQAVLDTFPKFGDGAAYWNRVRVGSKLGDLGVGTVAVVEGFDIRREVEAIFARKAGAGQGAHSDYCRIGGRTVNEWLKTPAEMPGFLVALESGGWVKPGSPVEESRFWKLLSGDHAEMFGVFSGYEMQVIHDWLRGEASADGRAWTAAAGGTLQDAANARPRSWRVQSRLDSARGAGRAAKAPSDEAAYDPDLEVLVHRLGELDAAAQMDLLAHAMSPAMHWTPAGLYATQLYWERLRA